MPVDARARLAVARLAGVLKVVALRAVALKAVVRLVVSRARMLSANVPFVMARLVTVLARPADRATFTARAAVRRRHPQHRVLAQALGLAHRVLVHPVRAAQIGPAPVVDSSECRRAAAVVAVAGAN